MKKYFVLLVVLSCLMKGRAAAQSFETVVTPLVESSCIHCHDADTETSLNFELLGHDCSDPEAFRHWEQIFDRVRSGEMPPDSEDPPNQRLIEKTLSSLEKELQAASLARQQTFGRVPGRRLTKLELGYTLRDLLLIEGDVTCSIPDEVDSGTFDTVGSAQRISSVHMESYLKAADEALDMALKLGRNPHKSNVTDFSWLDEWHDKPLNLGGSVTRKLEDGIALFADIDYLTRFQFNVTTPGLHRITSTVAAYQSKEPVTVKLIVKGPGGGARLVQTAELNPEKTQTIEADVYLKPGDSPYLTFHTGQTSEQMYGALFAVGGAKNYRGKGIAIKLQQVAGPLFDSWPPASTRGLLHGLELSKKVGPQGESFYVKVTDDQLERIKEVVAHFAPRAFRRQLSEGELDSFIKLAQPAFDEGRDFLDVVRIPVRAMLSSTQFLMFDGGPGELDDYALANRLSYFLWKSMPDTELFALAQEGRLGDPKVLAQQVDRMLADEKSERFIRDFLGQWLRLSKINATTPDEKLYPEYDELLGDAIPKETELFFAELIKNNLSVTNLIDSDFTYVNRRLAEHYGIPNVVGQQFRKVELPADSPRGGVLTQASVLKTTANGTVTSPVMRGNFVLTNFLGTPPSPPPPSVGSIEPDTRGQTTIREILAAHRNIETCAKCHRQIDPPGFAMESFDPIGGFRENYRASGGGFFGLFTKNSYHNGPTVDASGITADGKPFSGMEQFKLHLLDQQEQVARNFISQLAVYSTGGEIQFADRKKIETILNRSRENDFAMRDIVHEVVQSTLFRYK